MLGLIRSCTLAVVSLASVIVLAISVSAVYKLGIAISMISLTAVVPVIAADYCARGSFVSWTAVELTWMGILWVLWLATAGLGTFFTGGCAPWYHYYAGVYWSYNASYCSKLHAISAFSFINAVSLLIVFIWVLVVGIRAHKSGNTAIWRNSAAEYKGRFIYGDTTPMADKGEVMGSV